MWIKLNQLTWYNSLWLWRWLNCTGCRNVSYSSTTVDSGKHSPYQSYMFPTYSEIIYWSFVFQRSMKNRADITLAWITESSCGLQLHCNLTPNEMVVKHIQNVPCIVNYRTLKPTEDWCIGFTKRVYTYIP